MKKTLFTLSVAVIAFVACNKEINNTSLIEEPAGIESETTILTFSSEKPQIDAETKTAWDGASSIVWSTGDKIRVGYTLDGTWMSTDGPADFSTEPKVSAKFYASNSVSIDPTHANSGTFTVPTDYTNSPSGSAVFYGIYPSTCTSLNSNYAPSLTVTIPTSQTPDAASFDKAADIMVGKTAATALSGSFPTSPVALEWDRIVAHADITFKNLPKNGDASISKITLAFNAEAKVVGTIYLDITNGTVTNTASASNQVDILGNNLSFSGSNIEAWACVLPVNFTSVDVTIKTDLATYTRSITGINKTFKKNARNTLGIDMSTATRTPNSAPIADGNYVLVVEDSGNYYAISSAANAGTARRDRSSISTPSFNPTNYSVGSPYTAANALIWTITNVTGGVKINLVGDTNSYMTYGNNTIPLGSSGAVIEVAESTGKYTFANSGRYIKMNGDYGFGFYSSGSSEFYAVPATGTPTISFAETSKSVAADATSVSFTYTELFLSDAPTVNVTSDLGSAVASTSISAGTLTVNLNENTTNSDKTVTLTVSATGAADVVLTITQAGVVSGTEVTFTAGTDTGATSVTKDGITITMSTMSRDDNYRTYASSDMTVSAETGKTIKQIVVTCTGTGTNNYGPGKFSGAGYVASESTTGTWTGSASSVTLSASAQVRMTSIVVTYIISTP